MNTEKSCRQAAHFYQKLLLRIRVWLICETICAQFSIVQSNAWLLSYKPFMNEILVAIAEFYGKTVGSEDILYNKYQKKIKQSVIEMFFL